MSMNYEERAEMRQFEIRIERLEREVNELKAMLAKKRGKDAEKAVADPTTGAEMR